MLLSLSPCDTTFYSPVKISALTGRARGLSLLCYFGSSLAPLFPGPPGIDLVPPANWCGDIYFHAHLFNSVCDIKIRLKTHQKTDDFNARITKNRPSQILLSVGKPPSHVSPLALDPFSFLTTRTLVKSRTTRLARQTGDQEVADSTPGPFSFT